MAKTRCGLQVVHETGATGQQRRVFEALEAFTDPPF